jgi:hypothetical protein
MTWQRGSFIDCFFPFAEHPARPGPMRHIAYLQTMVRLRRGELRALVMLTTTSPRMIQAIPEGLSVKISRANSVAMGMKNAFTIDVHRLALLPPAKEWFPDMERPHFIIAMADERLRDAITKRYDAMRTMIPSPAVRLGPSVT